MTLACWRDGLNHNSSIQEVTGSIYYWIAHQICQLLVERMLSPTVMTKHPDAAVCVLKSSCCLASFQHQGSLALLLQCFETGSWNVSRVQLFWDLSVSVVFMYVSFSPQSSITPHCLIPYILSQHILFLLWGPDWATACSQGARYSLAVWARSPVSLERRTGSEGPPGSGGSLL